MVSSADIIAYFISMSKEHVIKLKFNTHTGNRWQALLLDFCN